CRLSVLEGDVVRRGGTQGRLPPALAAGPLRDGGLARPHRASVANAAGGEVAFVDFSPYAPSGEEPTGFVAAPVYGETHEPIGVLAFEMPVDRINRVMQVAAGLGRTGETIIVGPGLLLRSDSRFSGSP